MRTLNKLLALAATALLFTACGVQESSEVASKKNQNNAAGAALAGDTVVSCSFSVNGKTVSGKTQAECDKLKADSGIVVPSASTIPSVPSITIPAGGAADAQVACAFNINGKLFEGKSQAECDKLKAQLSIPAVTVPPVTLPNAPAPAADPGTVTASSSASNGEYKCSFNINGKLSEGKSQAECDKLKADLGL